MTEDAKTKLIDLEDRKWWQSKKWWIWALSFSAFTACLLFAVTRNLDRWIGIALVCSMACVSMTGMLGQAFVDAAVRFAKAWRGLDIMQLSEQKKK